MREQGKSSVENRSLDLSQRIFVLFVLFSKSILRHHALFYCTTCTCKRSVVHWCFCGSDSFITHHHEFFFSSEASSYFLTASQSGRLVSNPRVLYIPARKTNSISSGRVTSPDLLQGDCWDVDTRVEICLAFLLQVAAEIESVGSFHVHHPDFPSDPSGLPGVVRDAQRSRNVSPSLSTLSVVEIHSNLEFPYNPETYQSPQ